MGATFQGIYQNLHNFLDEINPFLSAIPFVWGACVFIWAKFFGGEAADLSRHSDSPNVSASGRKKNKTKMVIIDPSAGSTLTLGITSEVARIVRLQPSEKRLFLTFLGIAGIFILTLPPFLIFFILAESAYNTPIAFISAFMYLFLCTRYLIVPNADIAVLDVKFRFGVQLTIRESEVHFLSFDTMEAFSPEPIPGAKTSSKSALILVKKSRRGLFADRVAVRLLTEDGWIDLITVPYWLFSKDWKKQFSAFSVECTRLLRNPYDPK